MAYTSAYTAMMARRDHGTSSLFQRCEKRYGCPALVDSTDPVTGLVTKVRPDHACKGRWFGQIEAGFTANGTRRRITVSDAKKSVAARRLRDKRAELERDGAANTRRTITVAKWAAEWLTSIETKVRPSSLTTDKAATKWIVKTIGHHKLNDLTPHHVRSVAAAIRSAGHSTSTALRYHGPLIRMLKAAALEGYSIPPNVLLTEAPTAAVNDKQALPLDDAKKMLAHLTRRGGDGQLVVPDSSRWSLAFLQGIRQAESLGLTWDQVDLERNELTVCWQAQHLPYRVKGDPSRGFVVPDGFEAVHLVGAAHLVRPKSSSGWRTMPLVPWAAAALTEWREHAPANAHGLVWPGRTLRDRRGSRAGATWPRNAGSDRDDWAALQTEVGVQHPAGRPFGPHEIRHTTATILMELRVPESVRIAIIGHSTARSTKVYERVDPEQMRLALAGVSEILELPA